MMEDKTRDAVEKVVAACADATAKLTGALTAALEALRDEREKGEQGRVDDDDGA